MKIEPFPWFEGYLINMDELYTELTLEKVEKKLLGEERKKLRGYQEMFFETIALAMKLLGEKRRRLEGYQEMFHCNQSNPNNRKVLMKADPGMGKTTLGKKMTWDWAKGVFKEFSIIFFVSLKLVNPNDLIENAIILQNPELEGLGVSQEKLKALLNRFSDRILIILDGLDEHRLGHNGDVLKMIKNQKLLGCSILISSRPHSTWQIEEYFPTIVRVEGFTKEEARKFVYNFFTDENKIEQIMEFRPSDSREDFPVHKCPILLSILCFLVNKKEVDLSDTNITIGDLYFKMVKCLYKKYTIKKGITYQESDLIEVMRSVGQLALHTLLSNNPLLQRSEVLKIAGDFVLDYGFLAGDKAFSDLTADISVTYAHRSIEEFFGSFGFIQGLSEGKSVDDILGLNCENPIFMVNSLVFKFCLWFQTQKFFNFPQNNYLKLVLFAAKRIDFRLLDTTTVEKKYPAMNVSDPVLKTDALKLKFLKNVLEKCHRVSTLNIHSGVLSVESNYELADRVLGLMSSSLLSKLTCLLITDNYSPPPFHPDPLAISITPTDPETLHRLLDILLPKYNLLKRNPQVYAKVVCRQSHDLSTLMTKHIKQLRLVWSGAYSHSTLFVSGQFPHCPQLTHLTIEYFHIDDSVHSSLMKAVQNGKLPHLQRLELFDCEVSDCEWPAVSEFSFRTSKMLGSSEVQKLLSKLTELTVCFPSDIVIPVCLENLSVLKLAGIRDHICSQINDVLANGKLPNLTKLHISRRRKNRERLDKLLDGFDPHKTLKLETLALRHFTISTEELKILSDKLTDIQLTELDLSYSGFTDNLSALFTHSFPRLSSLKLLGCKLNSNDVQSLARANVEGKLPQLRHLDISARFRVEISDLFTHSAQWNQLKTLKASDENVLNVDPECLTSVEELNLWTWRSQIQSITRQWSCLKVIEVRDEHIASCIADGVERGMFRSLTTIRCDRFDQFRPFILKFLKANICVEWLY